MPKDLKAWLWGTLMIVQRFLADRYFVVTIARDTDPVLLRLLQLHHDLFEFWKETPPAGA